MSQVKCEICGKGSGSLYRPFGCDYLKCINCFHKELIESNIEIAEEKEIDRFELMDFDE